MRAFFTSKKTKHAELQDHSKNVYMFWESSLSKEKNQPKLHALAFSLILRERCSFCSCSAKKQKAALWAASRFFALLAAAAKFRCSVHGNCSAPPTLSHILQPCDRALKSELRGEVSKAFIIIRFGLSPSNQVNSTTGLTMCPVATMACTALKPHSN